MVAGKAAKIFFKLPGKMTEAGISDRIGGFSDVHFAFAQECLGRFKAPVAQIIKGGNAINPAEALMQLASAHAH